MNEDARRAREALTKLCGRSGDPQTRTAWRRESGLDVPRFDAARAELLRTGAVLELAGDAWPTYWTGAARAGAER